MDDGDDTLALVTCQAHNTVPISRALARYLSERLARPVRFRDDLDWRDAYRGVIAGEIAIGWICGHPYTRLVDVERAPIELLAAPVMAGERYEGRPIYFSDVVVRGDSPFRHFADLRGASWAYNEPGSQSGYHITRYHLARMGENMAGQGPAEFGGFFGRVVATGAHLHSLQMVLAGDIVASAIDSTVLEWEIERDPTLAGRIRIIETLGPSPIPPLVVSKHLSPALRADMRRLLLALPEDDEGRALLALGRLVRFAPVDDAGYDAIRHMAAIAAAELPSKG
jgi:phosphonate transport system substrate-binding protein